MKNSGSGHSTKYRTNASEAGVSLVGVMIGLAIVAILGVVVSRFATNSIEAARSVARSGELEDLRRLIRVRLDCRQTLAGMTKDKTSDGVSLLGRNGRPIAAPLSGNTYRIGSKTTFKATKWNKDTGAIEVMAKTSRDDDFSPLFVKSAPLTCL